MQADTGFRELRDLLGPALPRSPFEFVPGVDVGADRRLFVDRATRPIPSVDDLRFVYTLRSGVNVAVIAERLPWDSNFFGYDVARLDGLFPLGGSAPHPHELRPVVAALLEKTAARGIRYLFASVDDRDTGAREALAQNGFTIIETRVFYHRPLAGYEARQRHDVRLATAADVESLSRTARDAVNPYDRFHADPFIRREDADRLMAKWVEASIAEGFADATIVPNTQDPTAFCTVRYHRDQWRHWGVRLSQPVFSAVGAESRGWYRKLISEIHFHLKDVGAEHVYLTTQAQNAPVLRTWEKLGYHYAKTERIFRTIVSPA